MAIPSSVECLAELKAKVVFATLSNGCKTCALTNSLWFTLHKTRACDKSLFVQAKHKHPVLLLSSGQRPIELCYHRVIRLLANEGKVTTAQDELYLPEKALYGLTILLRDVHALAVTGV